MSSLFSPPFVFSYAAPDPASLDQAPKGFVLLSRIAQGTTEMVGGEISFLSGDHHFIVVRYATTDSMRESVEAERKKLKKPATAISLGNIEVADCAEAMTFLEGLAEAYRSGETQSVAPAWRGAAQLLWSKVAPQPINAVRVLGGTAAQSRYDW